MFFYTPTRFALKLLIYSDLHLESDGFQPKKAWLDAVDLVVQAGDLNTGWKKPATWLRNLGRPVVYVPGNHEPWNDLDNIPWARQAFQMSDPYGRREERHVTRWTHDYHDFEDRLDTALTGSQAVLLRENRVHVVERPEGRYRFLGSTLWTPVDDLTRAELAPYRDFRRIRWAPGELFSPERRTALFETHRAWLTRALNEPFDGKTVVVTHHAPSLRSWVNGSWGDPRLYCTPLDHLVEKADLWVHGHVHSALDYRLGRCRVICNPRGHADEQATRRWFRKNLLVEI